jgi:hypothetical protein
MCDLFCGRGGWTKGFQAHGWHCIGIDLNQQPDYPGEFIQADIAHLIELPQADFYCCSSPCEQFSVHGMKMFHPNPKWPWLGLALFHRAKELIEATGNPYVMENVRPAQRFIGKNDYQFGPFSLWGNCFSVMWPWPTHELTRLKKKTCSEKKRLIENTEKASEIPLPLSSHIARMAVNL